MGNMDGWDMALLVAAGYVAVMALVRLMIRRRDQMQAEFHEEVRKEKQRRETELRKQQREQAAKDRAA